jgi:hypothetical protein
MEKQYEPSIITFIINGCRGIQQDLLRIKEEIMKPEIRGAFIGAAATLVVGIPTLWFTYSSYANQLEARTSMKIYSLKEEIKEKDEVIATYKQRKEVAAKQFVNVLETRKTVSR